MKEPFNKSYDTNQVLVNTDVKQQRVLTDEEKHSYRYFLQYKYIPELVADVSNGELPPDALLETDDWESYIKLLIDRDFFFEWDELRCDEIKVNDDYSIVLYTFPKPIQVPDAAFGAVLRCLWYRLQRRRICLFPVLRRACDEKRIIGPAGKSAGDRHCGQRGFGPVQPQAA